MVPDGLRAAGTTLGSPSAVHLWREALGLSQDLELGGTQAEQVHLEAALCVKAGVSASRNGRLSQLTWRESIN